jgi:hypothetical protein
LSWWGIIGGALTLFTALKTTIGLADWARWLVEHWHELTHAFWIWAFGWLGIHLPPEWTPVLSFLLFASLLTVGQAVKFNNQPIADKYRGRSFRLMSWRTLFYIILSPVVFAVMGEVVLRSYDWLILVPFVGITIPLFIVFSLLSVLVLLARDRLNTAITIFIMPVFWKVIVFGNSVDNDEVVWVELGMIFLFPLILLSVAPAKAVSHRLIFLALGLLLLIALNELSKLGLDLRAPQG